MRLDGDAASTGASFSRADRIRSASDYSRARRLGVRRSGRRFTVIVAPGQGVRGRIGIAVPRQVGNAVVRNRLRRLVREYFRTRRDEFPDGKDVIVVPRPGVGWLRLRDLTEIGALVREACSPRPRRSG
ncbi:MAG: ribonuclease P protein component [bacterium]